MNEPKLSPKGEFLVEHSSWVDMKCLVATPLHPKSLRSVGGWMPLVSWDVVFISYP